MGTSEGARKGHTPESDAKRREAMRRKWQDPEYRARRAALEQSADMKTARSEAMKIANNDPLKRQQHSEYMKNRFVVDKEYASKQREWTQRSADDPKVSEARSEAMKRAWLENPGLFTNSLAAIAKDAASIEGRLRRQSVYARRAAAAPTTPHEHVICLALNKMGIPYFVHQVIDGKEADIYVPSHNLDIEVDGGNHYGQGSRRDDKRDAYLTSKGHVVLRLKHGHIENGSFISKLQGVLK